jgi:transposase InsO family protein
VVPVKRSRPSCRIEADDRFADRISKIKEEHPFWGYRRIWATLRYRDKIDCNPKRIYRIMKERNFLCTKQQREKIASRIVRPKPQATRPNQLWGTDMTKVFVEGCGWVYVTIVLDWFTKKIVGHHAGIRSRSIDWLEALEIGLNRQFPFGAREAGLKLVSDNGCQPTSRAFMKHCSAVGIEQIFTSYSNPKGNAETERFMRTMKEELLWLREWTSFDDLFTTLGVWIESYNREYLHSTLKYKTPLEAEQSYYNSVAA